MLDTNLVTFFDTFFLVAVFFSAVWIFSIVSGYGGEIGKSLKMIGWGVRRKTHFFARKNPIASYLSLLSRVQDGQIGVYIMINYGTSTS